jgi:DNA-binding transcriptional ArsR family regulator
MPSAAVAEDKIFHALADRAAGRSSNRSQRGEAAVKDLTARFDISQPAVSQHLAALKEAGLVNNRREGRRVHYRVEPRGMKPLIDWIAHYRAFWTSGSIASNDCWRDGRMTPTDTDRAGAKRIHHVRVRFATSAGEGVARPHRPGAAGRVALAAVGSARAGDRVHVEGRSRSPVGTAS